MTFCIEIISRNSGKVRSGNARSGTNLSTLENRISEILTCVLLRKNGTLAFDGFWHLREIVEA
jgi:hypothetical protein